MKNIEEEKEDPPRHMPIPKPVDVLPKIESRNVTEEIQKHLESE